MKLITVTGVWMELGNDEPGGDVDRKIKEIHEAMFKIAGLQSTSTQVSDDQR